MTASLFTHFPVPVLGNAREQAPYRRSWFLNDIRSGAGILRMLALLGALNRRRVAALPDRSIRTVYLALLDEMRARFPIEDIVYYRAQEEMDEEEMTYAADKIPVEVQAINPWEEQILAPLAVCFVLQRPYEHETFLAHQDSVYEHRTWLAPMIDALQEQGIDERDARLRLPRGRTWRRTWEALPELCRYCVSNTGYGFLDYDRYGMSENGWDSYPDLNLEEIRGLERGWKICKPILRRIFKLAHYIDNGGTKRLQLLANALNGDAAALREITVPKPAQRSRRK